MANVRQMACRAARSIAWMRSASPSTDSALGDLLQIVSRFFGSVSVVKQVARCVLGSRRTRRWADGR
jgi:hypothetical protein